MIQFLLKPSPMVDKERIVELDNWLSFDNQCSIQFPWYTRPFLKELITWDTKQWKVFEYGAGNSTAWWRKNAQVVHSVDSNSEWAKRVNAICMKDKVGFLSAPLALIADGLFDCIIIDGEPVEWRDECTKYALQAIKPNGIIIADNYEQATVQGLGSWPETNELLKTCKKQVFKEPKHQDWKTAFWLL